VAGYHPARAIDNAGSRPEFATERGSQKYVTSTAVPSTSKMLMAMMKRKNLPIGTLTTCAN
jgi:hypothetical protein